jgi:hypothetical protein
MEPVSVPTRRGRPRKFSRPARTVALTLPEDIIEALAGLDADLSRAVVRLALPLAVKPAAHTAEVSNFGARAVIVVPPNRVLASMPGVELVPLADGRALIALDDTMPESGFELAIRDAMEQEQLSADDRALLVSIVDILRDARRDGRVMLRHILVLRAAQPRRTGAAAR